MKGRSTASGEVITYVTPHGGLPGEPLAFDPEREVQITHLTGPNVYSVDDPLFADPYRIGDRSTLNHPAVDGYAKAALEYFGIGLHGSVRHLVNREQEETIQGLGRWASMQHAISAGMVAQVFGCNPVEVMYHFTHDIGKGPGGHPFESAVAPRDQEDVHDRERLSFAKRSGFIAHLMRCGVIDEKKNFIHLDGVTITDVLDKKAIDAREGTIINWPSSTGNLEPERVQYILQEGVSRGAISPVLAREIAAAIYRDPYSPEGDQLIFKRGTEDLAEELWRLQLRWYTENWQEPVGEAIDELKLAQFRFMMTYPDPALRSYQRHYVMDEIRMLEEDLMEITDSAQTSTAKAFNSAIKKITLSIAKHQRDVHAGYGTYSNLYPGPILPAWMEVREPLLRSTDHKQRTVHNYDKQHNGEYLLLEMQLGKVRTIDPWVDTPEGLKRITQRRPYLKELRQQQSRWCNTNYDIYIDLSHPRLGLTRAERAGLRDGLAYGEANWTEALCRAPMPGELLTQRVQAASARYRKIGRLSSYDLAVPILGHAS